MVRHCLAMYCLLTLSLAACASGDSAIRTPILDAATADGAESDESQSSEVDGGSPSLDGIGSRDWPVLPHVVEMDQRVLFTTFEGWTAHVSGGAKVDLTGGDGYSTSSTSALLKTDGASGAVYIDSPVLPAMDLSHARLRMALKVADRSKLLAGAPWIEVTIGNASFSSYYRFYWADGWSPTVQPIVADGEWSEFSWPWPAREMSGSPDRSAVEKIRFRIYDNDSGQSTTVQLGKVSIVPDMAELYPNGLFTIWFDDGWESVYTQAFPVLSSLGLRGTCAVITDAIGSGNYMTLAELQALAAAGWDVVEHSPTAAMHASSLTAVDPSVLLPALIADRAWFASHGFSDKYLAYPNGNWSIGGSTNVQSVARAAGFTAARTIWSDNTDAFPPSDPFTLRTKTVSGSSTTTEQIATLVRRVTTGPAMVGILYHQVVTGSPTTEDEINVSVFQQHMTLLHDSGALILPISEILP